MTVQQRVERLRQGPLREQALRLLGESDPVVVVMMLLRTIRERDDGEEAVRHGYQHSIDFERELHEARIDQEHLDIARAIEQEARRPNPRGRQALTYAGGLRKAARIARGWR
jgi:hypothetical protein